MIYDVTEKISGENFPYSDGCVLIFRTERGNVTVNFDPKISRDEAARALRLLAEGLSSTENAEVVPAEKLSENSRAELATDPARGENFSDETEPELLRKSVNPDDVAEDIVRWRDGYTAYKQNSRWWWIRWHDGANERWGMSGPLMSAVDVKKGPFDNFDETLASMMRHRAEVFQKNSYIG